MAIGLTSKQLVDKFLECSIHWRDNLEGKLEAIEHGESPELDRITSNLLESANLPVELVKMTPYILALADMIVANNTALTKVIPHVET